MWKSLSFCLIIFGPLQLAAQKRGLDVAYGRWWYDNGEAAEVFSVSLTKPWFGPVSWGVGVNHASDGQSFDDRTTTGGELFLRIGGAYGGPYAVGAFGLGRLHNQGSLDAQWSVGGGWAYDALSFLRLNGEVRYRTEDQFIKGFWDTDPSDRGGILVNAGLAIRFGGAARPNPPRPTRRPPVRRPPENATPTNDNSNNGGRPALSTIGRLPRNTPSLAGDVVKTALDAMGSPYHWGGTDGNGFDCSGLIQYAYAQHGIVIPRVSRDQANYGEYVEPRIEGLRPGDILGFAITGGRVSHVGLYVGDGEFIHSSSTGVRLSTLDGTDGNSLYYQRRWVVARRVLNE